MDNSVRRAGGTRSWICCQLSFKGRRRTLMAPRRYTELFFLDEATALAAGHRPCFECRREAFRGVPGGMAARVRAPRTAPRQPWTGSCTGLGSSRAPAARSASKRRSNDLPDGVFVLLDQAPSTPLLVLGDRLLPWRASGYASARARPAAIGCRVLTPAPTVAVIRAGYVPIAPSCSRSRDRLMAGLGPRALGRQGRREIGPAGARFSRPPRAARAGNAASCARSARHDRA